MPLIVLYAIFMKKSTHLTKKILTSFGISVIIRSPLPINPKRKLMLRSDRRPRRRWVLRARPLLRNSKGVSRLRSHFVGGVSTAANSLAAENVGAALSPCDLAIIHKTNGVRMLRRPKASSRSRSSSTVSHYLNGVSHERSISA